MNKDGYPEDSVLEFIKSYDLLKEKTVNLLLEVIQDNWKFADQESFSIEKGNTSIGNPCMKLQLHTCGWSGNESIIATLESAKFPTLFTFWTKSERGGHYYFDIPLEYFKENQTECNVDERPNVFDK